MPRPKLDWDNQWTSLFRCDTKQHHTQWSISNIGKYTKVENCPWLINLKHNSIHSTVLWCETEIDNAILMTKSVTVQFPIRLADGATAHKVQGKLHTNINLKQA